MDAGMIMANGSNDQTTPLGSGRKAMKAGEFFGEVKTELFKIDWTSKEELKVYTKIVVAATLALGMGIYCMDLVIQNFLVALGTLVRLITG